MNENLFVDRDHPPTGADLVKSLGARRSWLEELRTASEPPPVATWKYYGPKFGWTLKLFAGSKNLCFITISRGQFFVGFVFGDRTVREIEASDLPAVLVSQIVNARRYAEGRGVRLAVSSRRILGHAKHLLAIKRDSLRRPGLRRDQPGALRRVPRKTRKGPQSRG